MSISFKATLVCDTYGCEETVKVPVVRFVVETIPGEAVPEVDHRALESLGWGQEKESDYYSNDDSTLYKCREHTQEK